MFNGESRPTGVDGKSATGRPEKGEVDWQLLLNDAIAQSNGRFPASGARFEFRK